MLGLFCGFLTTRSAEAVNPETLLMPGTVTTAHAGDVHLRSLGTGCDQCHTPEGRRSHVTFDHDLTRFPLVGLHVAVPCEQCHLTREYRDVGKRCIDYHSKDDVHLGQYGRQCDRCHSTTTWKGARVQ